MNSTDIVVKTTEGVAEVAARSRKLPQRLRTMLILIDGSLNAGQLAEAGAKLGVSSDFLDILLQQGLIAVKPSGRSSSAAAASAAAATPAAAPDIDIGTGSEADRFRAVQKLMNDTVVDALGFRAFFFTLKLEKCFTVAELKDLLDDYGKAITKGTGEDVARVLVARARDMLN